MEQPPGSIDDLQPQDLSTSSIASVIDLARKGEECVLSSTAVDALRIVKSPSWYTNSVTSSNDLHFPDTGSSDIILQSSDQIQPDNAFSNTTVTLSYVSRSCVFSNQDSLPQRAPICGVPSISKLSLPPLCHSDEGIGDTGYSLNQNYLEQVDGPVNLASQTELFQSSSHDQMGPESDGAVSLTWNSHETNGGGISRDGDVDKNGSWSSSAECAESSPETITPATIEEEEREGSDVIFLMSKKQVNPDSRGARDWCSLNREYISPLEDPVSPSISSQDDAEDVFALPQASSSPSGDNSYLETSDDVACNDFNKEGPTQPGSGTSNCTMMLDSTNEMEQPVQRRSTAFEPLVDLTDDVCLSEVLESEPKTVSPHMNRNAKTLERSLKENKLPMRSGRGMRLETIVMNINSSRYNLSGCIRTNKKTNASQSTARNCKRSNTKRNDTKLGKGKVKASISVKTMKQKTIVQRKMGETNNINNTDSCKDFTSDSDLNHFKKSHGTTPPKTPPLSSHKNSKKEPEQLSQPDISVEVHAAEVAPTATSTSPKKSPGKASVNARGSKTSPTAKRKQARSLNSRRKQHKNSQPFSMFSPDEPEIKLRYVNHKEEKRDSRLGSFSPFIHVELQRSSPSLCTVVNYPEETKTQHKKGQPAQSGGFVCAVVPSTSCLQLGRVSTQSQHQRSLICCLCRLSANAMDLGDLHGPYYPEGYQPSTKTSASVSGPKAEPDGYSDSDSSSCSVNDRGRKRVAAHTPRPLRLGAQLKQKGLPEPESQWRASDNTRSPTAKRARSDVGSADGKDWYSPPVLPLEPCEYWLHEDCGIWSAGVFLVKGKVYGLEEVVKVAQETMCSACSDPGATLGCFFKNCPNKYHYRCALESGCVLIEENFSMKCKKHKNKTFKASSGSRWEDR